MEFAARFDGITTQSQHDTCADVDGFDSLDEAIEFARNVEVKITLLDAAGFVRGWVHPDGNYSLT